MKVIHFLVIGESGVGKSTLVDTFMWKLHFGYAYHDHLKDTRRYHLQLKEISQTEELQNVINQKHVDDILIYLACFKVSDRRSLEVARSKWLIDIWKIDPLAKVFLLGLQCDLRKRLTANLWPSSIVRRHECLNLCRYHENLHYLECSALNVEHVKDVFDMALHLVLYNEREATMRLMNFYNLIRTKFTFDENGNILTNKIKG